MPDISVTKRCHDLTDPCMLYIISNLKLPVVILRISNFQLPVGNGAVPCGPLFLLSIGIGLNNHSLIYPVMCDY